MKYLLSSRPLLAVTAAVVGTLSSARAATVAWVGDDNNVFDNALNWPLDTLPSLSADTWQVNGTGTQGNSTLTLSAPLGFTGTAGKIAFGASSGNMSLFENSDQQYWLSMRRIAAR
jgi:hypothetical protein